MMEEPCFSKLTDLIGKMVSWGLRTILGLTLGLQIVQSLVLPYADSAGKSAVMKFAEMVPGVGQATGAAARLVFGSSVLIKNSMGAAALAALLFLAVIPLLKLLVLALLYQGAAALVQPAADERVTECLSSMARGMLLLFKLTGGTVCLFFLSVALVCGFPSAGL